jgi:RNA polymerase sigma-70 factor (ECF subfamily)
MSALPPLSVLYRQHHRYALAVVSKILRDADEAEDVIQDVFVRLLSRPCPFDGQSAYRTWLHRILVNASINALRSRSRRGRLNCPVWEPENPAEVAEAHEHQAQFLHALGMLSPQHQLVVTLRDIRGYSYPRIAQLTGLPEGTVKSALNRARTRLLGLCQNWTAASP